MPNGIRVIKLGGSAMGSLEKIQASAAAVARLAASGERIVAVVSAMAGETDRLLALGGTNAGSTCAAELDVLAATGEQAAAALFAIHLQRQGCLARSFLGHELPIRTDATHGDSEISAIGRHAIDRELARGAVPVIAGFQGISPQGRVTTLGRGGSDTTAVAMAAVLGAEECIFIKDVDGIRTIDPKLCPGSRPLGEIEFRHLLALVKNGAKVLHTKCVQLAMTCGVRLRVTDSIEGDGGTRVISDESHGLDPRVVAISASTMQISVIGDFPRLTRIRTINFIRAALAASGISSHVLTEDSVCLKFEVASAQVSAAARCLHVELLSPSAIQSPILSLHWREA